MAATKPGTEEAFEQFYRRYERQVSRYLLGMLVDSALAADASQETWLRYLRYVNRPEPHFDGALLLAVARNVARTAWRRRPREASADLSPSADPYSFENSLLISDLVRRLPYAEREVIVLHYALDLPLEAVCRQVRAPVGTVKSRLYRARLRLREAYLAGEGARSGA